MAIEQHHSYCAICISRCGVLATDDNGVLTSVNADPAHSVRKSRWFSTPTHAKHLKRTDRWVKKAKLFPEGRTGPTDYGCALPM
jgi:hypothetical protein